MSLLLLLGCLFFSILSAGIFWLLEIVHYPLFRRIGPKDFNDYYSLHAKNEFFLVWIPPVIALLLGGALLLFPIWGLGKTQTGIGVGAILFSILMTAILILPQKKILSSHGYSYPVIKKLVQVNWVPTISWTLTGLYWLFLLFGYIKGLQS